MDIETIKYIAGAIIGVIVLIAVVNLLTLPFQILFKLIGNAIIGAIILYAINWFQIITIKITLIHCLIAGIFGIPGVIGIVIYNNFLK